MKRSTVMFGLAAAVLLAAVLTVRTGLSYDKMLKAPPAKFCAMCHQDKMKYFNTSGHGKVDVNCQACHNPHGDGNDKMLKKPAAEFCFMCHSDKKAHYSASGHGKKQVTCQMCHDPHGTPDDDAKDAGKAPAKSPK